MESSEDDGDPVQRLQLVASRDAMEEFREDVSILWCPGDEIPILQEPPTALQFLRDFVSVSRPCIIRNAITTRKTATATEDDDDGEEDGQNNQPIPLLLSLDDLVALHPHLPLVVDVTPDGHGDCLRKVQCMNDANINNDVRHLFVKPQERQMTMSEFRDLLRASENNSTTRSEEEEEDDDDDGDDHSFLSTIFSCTSTRSETSGEERTVSSLLPSTSSSDLHDHNQNNPTDCVVYYSRQNDCLRQELSPLWENENTTFSFPRTFPWAQEAFGSSSSSGSTGSSGGGPDAVNLWMGNARATSSMHKDHYENLFYVLDGEKVFTLCPPADAPYLQEEEVECGVFEYERKSGGGGGGEWKVRPQVDATTGHPVTVHWIATNVLTTTAETTAETRSNCTDNRSLAYFSHPKQVVVKAGEMLYLPSLWFHRVTQSCETVAINYWYDMMFESPLWCYFHLLQQLKVVVQETDDVVNK